MCLLAHACQLAASSAAAPSSRAREELTRHPVALIARLRSYDRDYDYDFFGFKTLERSYLIKMHGKVRVLADRLCHALSRHAKA